VCITCYIYISAYLMCVRCVAGAGGAGPAGAADFRLVLGGAGRPDQRGVRVPDSFCVFGSVLVVFLLVLPLLVLLVTRFRILRLLV
jgi:hypothetical protein